MKLAVSNIAWDVANDYSVAKVLRELEIGYIEIAPSKYSKNFRHFNFLEITNAVKKWDGLGIKVSSMQSLLFGLQDLTLFGGVEKQNELKKHLLKLNAVSNVCEIGPLVFGSPKNRNRGELELPLAKLSAVGFFKDLASNWEEGSSFLVIESNPIEYGCDFLITASETFEFVSAIDCSKIKNHIDFACTELGGEDPVQVALYNGNKLSHVHLSEKNLGPLKMENKERYKKFLTNLKNKGYEGVVTLEMMELKNLQDLYGMIYMFKEIAQNC
jgi:hypothetical protein